MNKIFKKKDKRNSSTASNTNEINLNDMGKGYSNLNQNDD
jgi:hypothetical protein